MQSGLLYSPWPTALVTAKLALVRTRWLATALVTAKLALVRSFRETAVTVAEGREAERLVTTHPDATAV